ncbi:MAG: DUF1622 domain-containing protein [Ginsengibacter sp.]
MEEIAKQITINVSHAVEILAAVIIGIAVIKTLINYSSLLKKSTIKISKEEIRVQFGSSVAVSLELLLGADVLTTAVAPSWDGIGKLAAIAVLRTALNYFLERELKHMSKMRSEESESETEVITNRNNNFAQIN